MVTIFFSTDEDDYIDGWGSNPENKEGEHSIELPKGHDFFNSDAYSWRCESGQLVFDEERNQERIADSEKQQNKMKKDDMNALAILELAEQIELLKGGN